MPRLTDLTAVSEVTSDDVLVLVDGATTKKATAATLKRYMSKVITVGPTGSGATYITDGAADELEINTAITEVNLAGGGTVLLLPGSYTIDAPITLQSGVVLRGSGKRVTNVLISGSFLNSNRWGIGAAGALTTGVAVNLATNALPGATTITATAGIEYNNIAVGDYLMLVSDELWETLNQSNRERGEYVRVVSKASPNLTIYGMVRDQYSTTATARLYRVSFVESCGIADLTIRQYPALDSRAGNVPPLISLQMCRDSFVENCEICENDGPGLTDFHSVGSRIEGNFIHDLTDNQPFNRLGYGVLVGGCSENTVVTANRFDRMRHAIDAGPSTSNFPSGMAANGIPRGVAVVGNTVLRCSNTGISTHSECEGWEISGNTVENCESCGIAIRGRSCSVVANKVAYCSGGIAVGSNVYSSSAGSGAGTTISGNVIKNIKNITPGSTGTNFGGHGIILAACDNVTVADNSIQSCDASGIRIRQYSRRNAIVGNTILNANLLNTANISCIEIEGNPIGTTASLTLAGSVITVTGLSSVANPAVGKQITISGASTPANNGTFLITAVLSATSVTYTNPTGATDALNGAISWYIESATDNLIDRNTGMNTAASEFDRDATGHAKYFIRDAGTSGNRRNAINNNSVVGMETDLLSFHTNTAFYLSNNNVYSAALGGVVISGNEKQNTREYNINVRTPAGGVTPLLLVQTLTNRNYVVRGFIQGTNGGAGIWLYDINTLFLNNAGALSQPITPSVVERHESSGSVTCTCDYDSIGLGTVIRIQISSIASPVTWTGRILISEARF